MDAGEDGDRRGVELPPDALSPEALRDLVEEFVTRDGTDYGAVERGVEEKVAQVTAQLRSGEAISRGRPAPLDSWPSDWPHASSGPSRVGPAASPPAPRFAQNPDSARTENSRPRLARRRHRRKRAGPKQKNGRAGEIRTRDRV